MMKKIKFLLEKNKYVESVSKFLYHSTYTRYKVYKRNKNFLENGQEVLEEIDKVFIELKIDYWLDFGTLLGAYRNKDFIKHDLDIDIGMYLIDYNSKNEEVFKKYGFVKIIDYSIDDGIYGREETYRYLNVDIDIFYYTKINDKKAYYHDFVILEGSNIEKTIDKVGGLIPRELTLALEKIDYIDFLGKQYPVPLPVEKHLADRYGEGFMVENSSWKMDDMSKNIKILEDKVGIVTKYA